MPIRTKVHERFPKDAAGEFQPDAVHERFTVDAHEMVKRDPGRFSLKPWPARPKITPSEQRRIDAKKAPAPTHTPEEAPTE